MIRTAAASFAAVVAAGGDAAEPARSSSIELSAFYTADTMATVSGGSDHRVRYLDALDLIIEADLERVVGWRGAKFYGDVLNTLGKRPNDSAGTLQGINNIEVPEQRLRLFEAWIEQKLTDQVTLRGGLYDLNSEFYVNDAASLLLGPAFGVGTELALTGTNGPSIYPSTALAIRLDATILGKGYARAALFNARAGSPGDRGGMNGSFDDGILAIVEAGYAARAKFGVGFWRYSNRQDDVRRTDSSGNPLRRRAQGAYVLLEYPFRDPDQPQGIIAFTRLGLSDGDTGAVHGGWQAGLLVTQLIAGREESLLSFGVSRATLSRGFRRNRIDAGIAAAKGETQFEITYSDQVLPFLSVQPDLQYIPNPGADGSAKDALVAGLRLVFEL